jgi:hypothetical protein
MCLMRVVLSFTDPNKVIRSYLFNNSKKKRSITMSMMRNRRRRVTMRSL